MVSPALRADLRCDAGERSALAAARYVADSGLLVRSRRDARPPRAAVRHHRNSGHRRDAPSYPSCSLFGRPRRGPVPVRLSCQLPVASGRFRWWASLPASDVGSARQELRTLGMANGPREAERRIDSRPCDSAGGRDSPGRGATGSGRPGAHPGPGLVKLDPNHWPVELLPELRNVEREHPGELESSTTSSMEGS